MRAHTPLLAQSTQPSSKATSTRYVNLSALILALYRMIDEALALDVFWAEGLTGLSRVGIHCIAGISGLLVKFSLFSYLATWSLPVRGRQVTSGPLKAITGLLSISYGGLLAVEDYLYTGTQMDLGRYNETVTDTIAAFYENKIFNIVLASMWGGLNAIMAYQVLSQVSLFLRRLCESGEKKYARRTLDRQLENLQIYLKEERFERSNKIQKDKELQKLFGFSGGETVDYAQMARIIQSRHEEVVPFLFTVQAQYNYSHLLSKIRGDIEAKRCCFKGRYDGIHPSITPSVLRPRSANEKCVRFFSVVSMIPLAIVPILYNILNVEEIFNLPDVNASITNASRVANTPNSKNGSLIMPMGIAIGSLVGGSMMMVAVLPLLFQYLNYRFQRIAPFDNPFQPSYIFGSVLCSILALISLYHRHSSRDNEPYYFLPMITQFIMGLACLYTVIPSFKICHKNKDKNPRAVIFEATLDALNQVPESVNLESVSEKLLCERWPRSKRNEAYRTVCNDGLALGNFLEYRDNQVIVAAAVKQNPAAFQYASERLKNDPSFVAFAVRHNQAAFQYASERLKNDVNFIKTLYPKYPEILDYATENVKNDAGIKNLVFWNREGWNFNSSCVGEAKGLDVTLGV